MPTGSGVAGRCESTLNCRSQKEPAIASHWYARYWHNDADFYDLFGPTKRSRKGDAYVVGYDRGLLYDGSRQLDFSARVAHYTGLDTLPGNQNIATAIDSISSADFSLNYRNTRKSLCTGNLKPVYLRSGPRTPPLVGSKSVNDYFSSIQTARAAASS